MSVTPKVDAPFSDACLFCKVARGDVATHMVAESPSFLVFLDHRPLFRGHCLVIPRGHYETIDDLPEPLVGGVFLEVQRVSRALTRALGADGTFVAMNNRVSQSVPHVHAHVVPRRKKDGLKGFFWPRESYESDEAAAATAAAIRAALV
ncbi:MAG TPA: HIT family protein [Polyangiaceae bacterium]